MMKISLLYENVLPYTASQTVETIKQFDFEVLEQPAYNPDLTPSRMLKDALQNH